MDAQQIITLGIVAVAASFLAKTLWKSAQGAGCDGCAGACGKPVTSNVRPVPQATPLIALTVRPKR